MQQPEKYSDEDLIREMRATDGVNASRCREILFARVYPKIAGWCFSLCRDRDIAADLTQDVVERVHRQLDTFQLESRFTTWLYTVTRRTAINRLKSEARHSRRRIDTESVPEPADKAPAAAEVLNRESVGEQLRGVIQDKLEPLEAQAVYLHYVCGMTLPAITAHLGLTNKSGSKAYIVGGMRKLRRHLGPWLERNAA